MKLYFDLDGVIRDLSLPFLGPPKKWISEWKGQTVTEWIDENIDVLSDSPPTKYYRTIERLMRNKKITILTKQPEHWRERTEEWVSNYFDDYELIYVTEFNEKGKYLNKGSILIDDYPLYPESMHSRLAIIDYPYNKKANCFMRITEMWQLEFLIKSVTNLNF